LSFAVTLRYQYVSGGRGHWYLAANYFDPKAASLFKFIMTNTRALLMFVMPGRSIVVLLLVAAVIVVLVRAYQRRFDTFSVLVVTTLLAVIGASVANIYPYGGVRQCLFLAPLVDVFAGVIFAAAMQKLPGSFRLAAGAALVALILVSGYRSMLA